MNTTTNETRDDSDLAQWIIDLRTTDLDLHDEIMHVVRTLPHLTAEQMGEVRAKIREIQAPEESRARILAIAQRWAAHDDDADCAMRFIEHALSGGGFKRELKPAALLGMLEAVLVAMNEQMLSELDAMADGEEKLLERFIVETVGAVA